MRIKLLNTFILLFFCILAKKASAQFVNFSPNHISPAYEFSLPFQNESQDKGAVFSYTVNYDIKESATVSNYERFLWQVKQNKNPFNTDSTIDYALCVFDTIADIFGAASISTNDLSALRIDSVIIGIGHENNSGKNDTIRIEIVELFANGYPGSNVLYAEERVLTSGASPANQWSNPVRIGIAPNYYVPNPLKFGVKISYKGAAADTFGMIAGHAFEGNCVSVGNRAVFSQFYPNSFAYIHKFNDLIPTYWGGDIYYDCNQNAVFDTLNDGTNKIQNWDVTIKLSATTLGLDENKSNIQDATLQPNPAKEMININATCFQEGEKIEIEIRNSSGKCVRNFQNNYLAQMPIQISDLSNGIYYVSLKNAKITQHLKMIVIR